MVSSVSLPHDAIIFAAVFIINSYWLNYRNKRLFWENWTRTTKYCGINYLVCLIILQKNWNWNY